MPWKIQNPAPATPVVYTRNPYYHVVDEVGNQLPYIDRRILEFVNDIETIKLRALGGDITAGQVPGGVGILPQLLAKREAGELQVQVVGHGGDEQLDLEFNRTHEDPVLAEIFQNPQFSIAVSHAINRDEINRVDYLGLAEPMQFGPKEGSPVYSEALKKAYIDYDPAQANHILDEIGLNQKDRDGFRMRPDGKTFEIVLYNTRADSVPEATHELVADYLIDIGIKTTMKRQNRGWDTLTRNDWEAMLGSGHRANGAYFYTVRSAAKFIPYVNNLDRQGSYPAYWSGQWNIWLHTEGAAGVRPPQVIFDINEWAGKMMAATTEDEKKEYARMIIEAGHENMWAIGILGKGPNDVFVADTTVGNFYDLNNSPTEWRYNVDQLYIKG
jgi:peptide/nickel transport system substrate-binding protein